MLLAVLQTVYVHADIFRADTQEVIPGTEGITPGPGVVLVQEELSYAELSNRDLTDANFFLSTLTRANLSESNLTGARLPDTILTDANLSGANLTNASLSSATLTNTNLSGAIVTGADFRLTPSRGFTHSQLASKASFQANNLQGIGLSFSDLTAWDLSGQDLTDAVFFSATLTNVDFSGAAVVGASFGDTTAQGFTQPQLVSTASYQAKNLPGIGLSGNALNGWDFGEQNLAGAILKSTSLVNANLSLANLTNADVSGATLTNADLNGANLANANLSSSMLGSSLLSADTTYNQWTVFPAGFDPVALSFVLTAVGDFDANNVLDSADIDLLLSRIHDLDFAADWLPDELFDLNNDALVDVSDVQAWVVDVRQTFLGDADLSGSVEFADFLILSNNFGQAGSWGNGDFDNNGTVEFADFLALAENFGEVSDRLAAVPEPTSKTLLVAALFCVLFIRRRS